VTLLYFAYGSNLHPARLAERAPCSELLGVAALDGHALRFHKRADDTSAKCDVVVEPAGTVFGALFRLAGTDLRGLDAAEGGYARVLARVRRLPAGEPVEAWVYRAPPDRVAAALQPFGWYRDLVVAGARFHELPAAYVAAIEAVTVCDDPDLARGRAMAALLARLRPG
jgi:hypothetical protein